MGLEAEFKTPNAAKQFKEYVDDTLPPHMQFDIISSPMKNENIIILVAKKISRNQ